jgi:hypothetical protein
VITVANAIAYAVMIGAAAVGGWLLLGYINGRGK